MKKKKLLAISILFLFAFNILAGVNLGPEGVSAFDSPAVYVDPASTTGGPTSGTYIIEISTDYTGDNIKAYQFSLTWNPLVLEGVSVVNDGILDVEFLVDFGPGAFTAGSLAATFAYYIPAGGSPFVSSGPGKLATVTFNIVGTGDSDIILGSDTYLLGWDDIGEVTYKIVNGVTMPFHLGHGYFENLPSDHDIAVTSVTASETEVVKGEPVTIDVDVANLGTVSETFDVTVWTGALELETRTVTDLAPGATTLTFNWDTTEMSVTTYTISAMASIVPGETDTENNALTDGDVNVIYAIAAIIDAPSSALYGTSVHFDGTNSYAMGANIVSYFWDTGDPHTGQLNTYETAEFDHTYKWPGDYAATLIITDDQNRTSVPDYQLISVYEPRDAAFVGYSAKAEKHKWFNSTDDDGLVKVTALARNLANETMVLGVRVAILDVHFGTPIGPVYDDDRICPLTDVQTFELFVNPSDHGWDGETKLVMYTQVTLLIDTTFDGTPNEVVDTKNIRFSVEP